MTQQDYILSEIKKADEAISKAPTDAVRNGHFARKRKLAFALEIIREMGGKKFTS